MKQCVWIYICIVASTPHRPLDFNERRRGLRPVIAFPLPFLALFVLFLLFPFLIFFLLSLDFKVISVMFPFQTNYRRAYPPFFPSPDPSLHFRSLPCYLFAYSFKNLLLHVVGVDSYIQPFHGAL